MKILCIHHHSGPLYVRTGWGRAFVAAGHRFNFWITAAKSAFDAFSEYEPDVFIGTTYDLDRAMVKNIVSRPEMKVILFGSAWGERIDEIDKEKYPIVVASDDEKRRLEKLKKETGKPDFVFVHVTDKYLESTMGGWRSIGIEPVGILNAADTFMYYRGEFRESLKSDIAFCGGYWGYKARNLDRFLLPLTHRSVNLNAKIFGNQPWPIPQFLGIINDKNVKHLFASATVCPNVSEPHSTDLGWDIVERPFKVMASGGFCISDAVDEMDEIFTSDELVRLDDPVDFQETVLHFVQNPDRRARHIELGQKRVLEHHTYFDRVNQMLTKLGMHDEAGGVMAAKDKWLNPEEENAP